MVTQLNQVLVAAWSSPSSEDISEPLSEAVVTRLTTTLANPKSANSPMMSFPLIVLGDSRRASIARGLQYVADAADGVDERRAAGVDLLRR